MLEFLESTSDIISIKYYIRFLFWVFILNFICALVPRYTGTVVQKFTLVAEKKKLSLMN
jgi:hypothetical protein